MEPQGNPLILDVEALLAKPKLGRPLGAVGRIREVHHLVARLFARGHKPPEIARMVNRTPATVRNWLAAPATAELVASFAEEFSGEVTSELEYRAGLRRRAATLAAEELVERLEADPAGFRTRDLLAALDSSDDRTGLARQETRVNVNLDLGARLDQARAATRGVAEARAEGNVVRFVRREGY